MLSHALILLAAGVAMVVLFFRGNSCGHDFDFHIVSWMDCYSAWRLGIPYPHWATSANYGAGEPRFVFYPPLTWMLAAAMRLVMHWWLVPKFFTFALLAATGMATRALARQALPEAPATLAGCAALYSGYALFCAYERSAFGELTGGFWMPLVLLLILRDRNSSGSALRRAFDGSAALLTLVIAGAWLSNAPVGVMASYLLAAAAVVVAVLDRSWAPILRAATAATLGIALSAIYLVPAAVEQSWVNIRQATDDPGEKIENSWIFARHANPELEEHDIELMRVSLIGASMIAVAVGGLLVSHLRKTLPGERRWWIPLAIIPFAVLLLQLPISLPVWNLLPKLRFLQFPWRWQVVLEAPMAIFFATAVWPVRPRLRVAVAAICTALFLAAATTAGLVMFQECDDEDNIFTLLKIYPTGAGFEGTDEYAPLGADNSLAVGGLPPACLVSDPTIQLGEAPEGTLPTWDPKSCDETFGASPVRVRDHAEHFHVIAIPDHAGYLILRLRTYPAWQIRVNGRPVGELPHRDDGLMAIPVPQAPVDLTVDWATTPDVRAGRWISLLAVLLLAGLGLSETKLCYARRAIDAKPN